MISRGKVSWNPERKWGLPTNASEDQHGDEEDRTAQADTEVLGHASHTISRFCAEEEELRSREQNRHPTKWEGQEQGTGRRSDKVTIWRQGERTSEDSHARGTRTSTTQVQTDHEDSWTQRHRLGSTDSTGALDRLTHRNEAKKRKTEWKQVQGLVRAPCLPVRRGPACAPASPHPPHRCGHPHARAGDERRVSTVSRTGSFKGKVWTDARCCSLWREGLVMVPEVTGGAPSFCSCWEEVRVTPVAPCGMMEEEGGQGSRKVWPLSSGLPGGDTAQGADSSPSSPLEK